MNLQSEWDGEQSYPGSQVLLLTKLCSRWHNQFHQVGIGSIKQIGKT